MGNRGRATARKDAKSGLPLTRRRALGALLALGATPLLGACGRTNPPAESPLARQSPAPSPRPTDTRPAPTATATSRPSSPAASPTPSPTVPPTPTPSPTAAPTPTFGPLRVVGDVPPLAEVARDVRYGAPPQLKYKGEIVFWAHEYTPVTPTPARPYPPRYLNRVIAEYQSLHPDIAIRLVSPTEVAASPGWLRSKAAGRAAPDVFWGHHNVLSGDLPRGAVADLRPWLDKPNPYVPAGQAGAQRWRDLFVPWILDSIAEADGAIYQITADAAATVLFYNKEAFAKVGRSEPPATFRDFLEVQAALRAAGYVPILLSAAPSDYRWSWWAREAASVLYANRFDELRVEGPRSSLSLLSQVVGYRKGILHPRQPAYTDIWRIYKEWSPLWNDAGDVAAPVDFYHGFAEGKAAIMWNGTWVVPQLLHDPRVKFEWGAFSMPVITRETSAFSTEIRGPSLGAAGDFSAGFQYWVSTDKANRTMTPEKLEACVDWLRFLSLPWNVEPLCNDLGAAVPTVRGARPLPQLTSAVLGIDSLVPVIAPLHAGDAEASTGYQALTQAYLAGRSSLEELRLQLTGHLDSTVERLARTHSWDLTRFGVG